MIFIQFLHVSFFHLSGGQLVEDVLTLGVPAKLMHFLRIRVLGDASSSQRDANHPQDTKYPRGRDDNRGKSRLAQDGSRLDGTRVGYGILTNPTAEKDNEPGVVMRQAYGERSLDGTFASSDNSDVPEVDWSNDNSFGTIVCDTKSKYGEKTSVTRALKDEEISENGELLKRKLSRAPSRLRVKGKAGDNLPECEMTPLSPTSGLRIGGRASRDRNVVRVDDPKKATDVNNRSAGLELFSAISKEEYEDRLRDCIIGLKDISDIVLKAVRAAEAEARSANAPDEAVKAAGDAAAELVKSAALEVWNIFKLVWQIA
jgi:DDB1- and CUL4-associated factor 1